MNAIITNNIELIINHYNIDETQICEQLNISPELLQRTLVFSNKNLELYEKIKLYVYDKIKEIKK